MQQMFLSCFLHTKYKRFYKENGHVRLQSENNRQETIIDDEVVLLGKVVYWIRNIDFVGVYLVDINLEEIISVPLYF